MKAPTLTQLRGCAPVGLSGLALSLLLAACTSAPKYQKPEISTPAQFKEAALFEPAGQLSDVPDEWWQLFADPVLNDLQKKLVLDNQNLRVSAAQLRSAQAALASAQASLWPTLSVGTSATRSGGGGSTGSARGTSYALTGTLSSWEIDLWDRLGNAETGARARLAASVDDLLAARQSAQATLVQTYFSLRATEAQERVLKDALKAYQRSLELTQNRQAGGVASSADVAQAQSQLQSTVAQQIEAQTQRAQLEHALAGLLGQAPAAFSLPPTAQLPSPPAVPALLPARLLQRRPDIAAAERRVAAANAQVGVAQAAFFPAISLSANLGFRDNELAGLISAPNRIWSLGPSLNLGIFDGGARQAVTDSALAAVDQAAAQYRQTVLTALQEVEDNLVAASQLQRETQALSLALDAARRGLEIVQNQYRAGTVSYLNVVVAQTTALSAERTLLDARNRQLVALNQLLKNIAGRWDKPV